MSLVFYRLLLLSVSLLASGSLLAAERPACAEFHGGTKVKKGYILLDGDGNFSKGPVRAGKISLPNDVELENFEIDIKGMVLVAPANAEVLNIPSGGYFVELRLLDRKFCENVAAYSISLIWNRKIGEVRPYKFSAPLPAVESGDEFGYSVPIKPKFDAVVVGTAVN
ncbi:hypothetical protein [Roseateles sp. BYS87W]|uniref:Uncharacterized protein n=1 Tax=Pelomonas baiyunensis TaxID=3299026 RepID=A0ABW7H500_9BURK